MLFGTYVIIREEKSFVYCAGLFFFFFFLMMFSGILNYFCLFTFGCPGSLLLPSLAVGAQASHCVGISYCDSVSNCGTQALGALWHVESYWTGGRTHIPFIGRQIRIHWTTREVLLFLIFSNKWQVLTLAVGRQFSVGCLCLSIPYK